MEHHPLKNFVIREATKTDIPEMIALLEELFAIETDFTAFPLKMERAFQLLLKDKKSVIYVAEGVGGKSGNGGKKLVGMVTAQLVISTAEGGVSSLLEDLIVKKDFRGAGVERLLVTSIEEWTRSKGGTRVQLLADKRNEGALLFYERNEYRETNMVCYRRGVE